MFSADTRFVPQIGSNPSLVVDAFKLNLKAPVDASIHEVNGVFFLIKLKGQESPDMSKFEKEKKNLELSLLYNRRRELMQDYITFLRKGAQIKVNAALSGAANS